ncbi:hypothetical protein B0H19DRAFT_1155783, partial [Mycena capillaripes]
MWLSFHFLVSSSTAICICTEQTFSEASTAPKGFCDAFSTALHVYLGSTLERTINEKIRALPWEGYNGWSINGSELHKRMI